MPSSVFDLNLAAKLVAVALTTHWIYLRDNAVHDIVELRDQQENWADMGLTAPDSTYLSKHNLGFTGVVDPSLVNEQPLISATTKYIANADIRANFVRFIRNAVPALSITELVRIVVHFGTTDLTDSDTRSFIQRAMDEILEWGLHSPGAIRVEIILKGERLNPGVMTALTSNSRPGAGTQVDMLRQTCWKIQTASEWTARFVTNAAHVTQPSFAISDSRFALRSEEE